MVTDDGIEQRGFARTIGADESDDFTGRNRQSNVVIGDDATEFFSNVFDHQLLFTHAPPPSEALEAWLSSTR